MKERIGHDVESYINYFCVGIEDYTNNSGKRLYEISEERNDIHKFYEYYSTLDIEVVSFNGIWYDNLIIQFILKRYDKIKNWHWSNITMEIKQFSDDVINGTNADLVKSIQYLPRTWVDIDLFLYWSKDLRLSKKISLKSLGIQLEYPVVQELPYAPDSVLAREHLEVLRIYNLEHDLGILKLLHDKMSGDIDLRTYIGDTLGVQCMSMDAPKIASEILLYDYCKQKRYKPQIVRKWQYTRNHIPLANVLKGFDPFFETDQLKNLFKRMSNANNSFGEDLVFKHGETDIVLTYGVGGLHSVNKNEKYYSNDTHVVITSDVASLYPSLIINYKCLRFSEVLAKYISVKSERLIAKANKDKQKDKLFKLILNSISGMMDNQYSWLYFPEGALRMRLIGQLILTRLIEMCTLKNWKVVSANTDGIEVIIPREDQEEYTRLMDLEIARFEMQLEHDTYDFIIYKNVNNYIARTTSGGIKLKGLFVTNPELGNSTDTLVIAKALSAHYLNDIDIDKFIRNPKDNNSHIYDYCKSNKIGRNFKVYHNGIEQQRLNRYFFKKNAAYLYKQKPGGNLEHVNVNQAVELFNSYEDKEFEEYDLNYSYYVRQCRDIIDTINNFNQLTLF